MRPNLAAPESVVAKEDIRTTATVRRGIGAVGPQTQIVVPVGELEGFYKSAGGHGPAWVAEVLKMNLKNDREFDQAKRFVGKILQLL
jgi:hypothetical protein